MTIVALDYLDWSAGGGCHFTAHLTFDGRERVELERSLSLREAKELMPNHSEYFYDDPYFRVTNRFDSFDQLVRAATKWCEANLTAPWMLLKRTNDDLRKILASSGVPETRVRTLNLIEAQWDKLTNAQRDKDTMLAFYAAWRAWKP